MRGNRPAPPPHDAVSRGRGRALTLKVADLLDGAADLFPEDALQFRQAWRPVPAKCRMMLALVIERGDGQPVARSVITNPPD